MKRMIFSFILFFAIGLFQTANAQSNCDCPAGTQPGQELVPNGTFTAGNTGFFSDLTSNPSCQNTSYLVAHEPRDKCTNSAWIDDLWDHTSGTSNGWYQIIDGPNSPTVAAPNRVWYRGVNVVAGTNYTFSFWMRPTITTNNNTNFRFSAFINNGNVSGIVNPPNTTNWTQYCYSWTSNITGLVNIDIRQMTNFAGNAYDYALDDISFRACENFTPPCEVYAKWDVQQNEFCEFIFTDYSVAGAGTTIVGYHWDFGDGQTSQLQNPTHIYASPGSYYVCLTVYGLNADGECCVDTYCQKVENECEQEDCKIVIRDITATSNANCDADLTVDVNSNRPIVGYYWDFGDGTSQAGSNPQSHTYQSPGTYYVCVTIVAMDEKDCCTETFCKKVKVDCHDGDALVDPDFGQTIKPASQKTLKIAPNPATSEINIEFNVAAKGDYRLQVVNLQGQVVLASNGQAVKGTEKIRLDTAQLTAGTYFVSVVINGKIITDKLIIQ